MKRKRGRPATDAWKSIETAKAELVRWKGGKKALGVSEIPDRAPAEAKHFLESLSDVVAAIRTSNHDLAKANEGMWQRRAASSSWSAWSGEASHLHAELDEVVGELETLRVEALRVAGFVREEARGGARRNEVGRLLLDRIRQVAPAVARSGTALAYWDIVKRGSPCRDPKEFARLEDRWAKRIARLRD